VRLGASSPCCGATVIGARPTSIRRWAWARAIEAP